MKTCLPLLALALLCSTVAIANDAPPAGTVIDEANVETYAEFLDETLVMLIKRGDFALEIAATEAFPPHPDYVALTAANAGKTKLGSAPGELIDYAGGRPFSEPPSAEDHRAGEKMAWNMRYLWSGDGGRIRPFYWQYRNMRQGKVERELSFEAMSMRFMHRTVTPPVPAITTNPSGIYNALYLRVVGPPDIRNTQLLIHRLEDDTRQEEGWLYLGTQRRVRRLPTGQNTDAFLGSDIMIEDFLGYNGRIMDMEWRYLGTREVLLPFFRHSELTLSERAQGDYNFVAFAGKGGCYPQIKWQFRTAYLMEAVPKWSEHPLSKRLYYVDAETFAPAYGRLYDNREKLWKFAIAGYSHPDHHLPANAGSHIPILDAVTMIDLQAEHCTTLQPRTEVSSVGIKASDFAVQALRARGR